VNVREMRCQADRLTIIWEDGDASEYHATWLRDNDPANRDLSTGQRLIDAADLPADLTIQGGRYSAENGLVRVSFSDCHASLFPGDWLHRHSISDREAAPAALWEASTPGVLHRFSYPEVSESSAARLQWLEALAAFGIAFLADVPIEKDKMLEVAAMIGWVRETNYGRIFDVRAVPDSNNLAYTSRALGLHTDNPYRDPVPGLQLLHCLCAGSTGGASLFADGFAVAEALRKYDPHAFEMLTGTPVRFEFADAATHLWAQRPLIQKASDGRVEAVAYNSRSIAPLRLSFRHMDEFYPAYRQFAHLLRDERFVVSTPLAAGELVAFDNRRVLHGRTAFSVTEPRWLQGCYLDHDGLRSHIAVLQRHGSD